MQVTHVPESFTVPASFKTMCPMNCHPTLCGMEVTVNGPEDVTITGDPTHPDSGGYLCMRGNAAHEIVGNPNRLTEPMFRETPGEGPWKSISWDAALDLIAERMEAVGRESVGLWQGHGNASNDYGFGLKRGQMQRFANIYGCQFWNAAMICWGLGGFGLGLTGALETSTKEDMGANAEFILLWGVNSVSQANTVRHVEAAKRRGAKVVLIDVRRNEFSALADETILIPPGTDTALALGMMHAILAEGLQDDDFIAAHTLGFEELTTHLASYTPEWAAGECGLAADQIRDLARRYATTRPAMIVLGGSSIHKGDNGWLAARAVACLPALTGNFGRPGAGFGPRHGAQSHGAGFTDITLADRRPARRYVPNQMSEIFAALEEDRVKVLLAFGSNMLSSFPDTQRLRRALLGRDLVVSYDIFMNRMARETAHLVLPGTIWLEEIGAKATNTHVYLSDRALPIKGQARPLYTIYQGLAARLGLEDVYPWPDQEAAMDSVLDHPATGHTTVAEMRANEGRAALKISHVAYPTFAFHTPSGKIEFRSDRAAEMGLPALPTAPETAGTDGDYPLRFAHGRTFAHFHGFYDAGQALPTLAKRERVPALWISPTDAEARSLKDGDEIELVSDHGAFAAVAKVTARIPAGAVWIRDGWPGLNALTDSRAVLPDTALDAFPFSVGQSSYGAKVEVRRTTSPEPHEAVG